MAQSEPPANRRKKPLAVLGSLPPGSFSEGAVNNPHDILGLTTTAVPSRTIQQENFDEGSSVSQAQNDESIEPPPIKRGGPEVADVADVAGVAGAVDKARQSFRRRQSDSQKSQFPVVPDSSRSIDPVNLQVPPEVVNSLSNSANLDQTTKIVENAIKQNPNLEQKLNDMGKEIVHMQLKKLQTQKTISKDEVDNLDKLVTKYGLKIVFGDEYDSDNTFMKFFTREEKKRINKVRGARIEQLGMEELSQISKSTTNIGEMVKLRDYVISKTGRENGPDIALKVMPSINDKIYSTFTEIINKNSSITEVMNLLAFLLNNNEQRKISIVKDFSIDSGTHDKEGNYTDIPNTHNPTTLLSVFDSLTGGTSPFDIATLKVYEVENVDQKGAKLPADTIILPAGILKRDSKNYQARPVPIRRIDIPIIISACVLQMINILENTRQVFGGWAKLFKGMQGGKSNSKSKKTRRRYNRRH
jgi:hypothetical protein